MNKTRGVYQGFFALSFMFLMAASFVCISMLGYCTEDWLPRNLAIGYSIEAILFFCGINIIRKGSVEILNESHSFGPLKDLYLRVLFLMLFGIMYIIILLIFPYGNHSNAILIYCLNIFIPALFFCVWMCIGIYKINRRMRYDS